MKQSEKIACLEAEIEALEKQLRQVDDFLAVNGDICAIDGDYKSALQKLEKWLISVETYFRDADLLADKERLDKLERNSAGQRFGPWHGWRIESTQLGICIDDRSGPIGVSLREAIDRYEGKQG